MMARAGEAIRAGVVAASARNHAQVVALGAQKLGIRAVIVMPVVTPGIKVEAVRRRGAEVVLVGDNFDEAKEFALRLADKRGMMFVPPFDDPDVIAGQGTIGMEILKQVPRIDAVFVPVGGGGPIADIATVIKRLKPAVKVFGVKPKVPAALKLSMDAGKRVKLKQVETFAGGVAVIEVGEETAGYTLKLCCFREALSKIRRVSEDHCLLPLNPHFSPY